MNDKPNRPLSLRKAGSAPSTPDGTAKGPKPSPPQLAKLAAGALLLSALAAIGASASVFGATKEGGWLYDTALTANKKLEGKNGGKNKEGYLEFKDLVDRIESTPKNLFVSSVIVALALTVLAIAIIKGKYWARWTTLVLWAMATLTGTLVGIQSITVVISPDVAASFKIPAFVASLAFLIGVVLVNMRPCTEYFKLSKPDVPTGGTPRRGLFAPRSGATPARGAGLRGASPRGGRASTEPAAASSSSANPASGGADRARTKQRSNADSAAKGAELARARAKAASKSRRTGA